MKFGRIIRCLSLPDQGTFGSLVIDAEPFCVTLEPYYRNNAKSNSCIPVGQYIGMPYNSLKFGPVYLLADTAEREMIEMHPGNSDDDTRGCILLGQYWDKLLGKNLAVLNSGKTFKRFLDIMAGDKLFLTIVNAF